MRKEKTGRFTNSRSFNIRLGPHIPIKVARDSCDIIALPGAQPKRQSDVAHRDRSITTPLIQPDPVSTPGPLLMATTLLKTSRGEECFRKQKDPMLYWWLRSRYCVS